MPIGRLTIPRRPCYNLRKIKSPRTNETNRADPRGRYWCRMKIRLRNPLKLLSLAELIIWITSLVGVTLSFLLVPERDYLTLLASLIGVSALIFVAKGMVFGQVLVVVFSVFYGIISFIFAYYGEMITYLGMSAPIAVISIVSWLKNPFGDSGRVRIGKMTPIKWIAVGVLTSLVTVGFYFILRALGTANLLVSTLSVATSFLAASLTVLRHPLYAVAYSANDLVLIALWVMASIRDIAYLPMTVCFAMFLLNDVYGFINWTRMKRSQGD